MKIQLWDPHVKRSLENLSSCFKWSSKNDDTRQTPRTQRRSEVNRIELHNLGIISGDISVGSLWERERKKGISVSSGRLSHVHPRNKADHQKGMTQTGRTTKKTDFPGGANHPLECLLLTTNKAIRGNKAAVKPHYAAIYTTSTNASSTSSNHQ